MRLLIALPTRDRLNECLNSLKQYHELSTHQNTRYVVSCDIDDVVMNNTQAIDLVKSFDNTDIVFNENKMSKNDGTKTDQTTKICAINSSVVGQDFDICLLASDDMQPEMLGYDTIIVNDMKRHFPDTDGVLWYNDGAQGANLNTLCILGKKYYDRFNYIYHPSYMSLFCDNEFTEVSKRLNKCVYSNDILIRHRHWSIIGTEPHERDSIYIRNDSLGGIDQANFKSRKIKGFPV